MLVRLLTILLLLIQPLALSVAMTSGSSGSSGSSGPSAACHAASCCEVVDRTCCDEVVREIRCGKTGGECLCAVRPVDPEPAPAAPRSQERNDIGPFLLAATRTVVEVSVRAPTQMRRMTPAIHRTHNETQALLCIWRT